jgi:hypothetical protein
MPQSCPHCGIALPAVADAFCPECREDLSATPDEVANQPTLADMGEAIKPIHIARDAICLVVGTVSCVLSVLGGVASREPEAALCGVIGLGVWAYWYHRLRQSASVRTSVTGKSKISKSAEQPK